MPPRKSNVSTTSNGADEAVETPSNKPVKDGMSVEDLSLPKSMIARLAKGVLPANTQIQKDALLALHKSATVFVSYIASNSNENARAGNKKTIAPADVMAALKDAELEGFLPRLEAELKKYNDIQCDKRNTYRRKVKEEKAAATVQDADHDGIDDGEAPSTLPLVDASASASASALPETTPGTSNSLLNPNGSHVQDPRGDGADAERPAKKLRAEDGGALIPGGAGEEDGDGDVEEVEDDDEEIEMEDEEEDDDEGGEEGEEGVEDESDEGEEGLDETMTEDAEEQIAAMGGVRDEALDDPDSD